MNDEIWKDIEGYEGLYQISNLGRVRSLDRTVYNNGGEQHKKGFVLKPKKSNSRYKMVGLCCNGKSQNKYIHRLVAQAFIPNPNNLPCVNHKDENKENNCIDNLEWCTHQYNSTYGTSIERANKKRINNSLTSKQVIQIDKEGNIIALFPSLGEIKRTLGFDYTNICKCCNGKIKTSNGYNWKYLN